MAKEKVLLITHGIDIDGYGCAILAKMAFDELEIIYADNYDIDKKIIDKLEDGGYQHYDKVYITDLCPSEDLCIDIDNKSKYNELKTKLLVLDHHKHRINGSYPWVEICVQNELGAFCGTELFYEHLLKQALLKPTKCLNEFVELTRIYDVEWSNQDFENAEKLNNLALALGREKYVEHMTQKLATQKSFVFDDKENRLVWKYLQDYNKKLKEYAEKVRLVKFAGYNAGYLETEELYKNNLVNAVKALPISQNMDFLMLNFGGEKISLRAIALDFDVSIVARQFGGGGHPFAASFPAVNLPNNFQGEKE